MKRILVNLCIICLFFPFISSADTIVLKSGKTVEGKVIEKTDKYIKVDFQGVMLTYYNDEIKSIDGQKATLLTDVDISDNKDEGLIEAAKKGDSRKVEQLIGEGVNIDAKDKEGTVLMNAVGNGNKEIVEFLLAKGADVNAGNESGVTPLVWAVTGCHKEIVELLISKGAKVNTSDSLKGMTPLMWAAHRCSKDTVELLLARGANIEMKDKNGKTAWIWSVANRNKDAKDVAELFLSKGADVNAKDNLGGTVLMWAAGMGKKEIVELLLSKGADVNTKDEHGRTALMWLTKFPVEDTQREIIKLLLSRDIDVDAKDNHGATASMFAEENGHKEIAEFLRVKEGLTQSVDRHSTGNPLSYDNDLLNLGIRFNPPSGWIKKISHDGLEGIQYIQPQNKASIVISVSRSSNYLAFLSFLEIMRIQDKPASEEKIDFLGGPCHIFIYEKAISKSKTFRVKNYIFFKDGKIFTIAYMALLLEFNNYLSDFEFCLRTFEIEQ